MMKTVFVGASLAIGASASDPNVMGYDNPNQLGASEYDSHGEFLTHAPNSRSYY